MRIEGVNENYTVVECEYSFKQNVNSNNGLPQSGLEASQIIVTIVTPSKGGQLYEWMLDEFHYLNGVIRLITNVNSHTPAKRFIWFENAKCVGLYEYFNGQNSVMMTTRLTIQPAKMGFAEGDKYEGTSLGYDFRHRRKTREQFTVNEKLDMDWQTDRRVDEMSQIVNDPNY